MITIYTAPQYQKLSGGTEYDLNLTSDNSGVSAMNTSPVCFEFDFSGDGDPITLNLPPISDFLKYRSAGIGFQINGSIIGGSGTVMFAAHSEEGNTDYICGDAVKEFAGSAGSTCKLYIAGEHNWGLEVCYLRD